MSVTSGFYDSLNGDRRYTARQMSDIFNGIINDGVFANIGEAFAVKAEPGNKVTVGVGRAWFNSTWVYNDAILTLDVPELTSGSRFVRIIDVLVLEVDRSEAVRGASAKFIEQTVRSSSTTLDQDVDYVLKYKLTNTSEIHQYPLAVIVRSGGSTDEVIQANIRNYIGTSHCPFVTGILQVQSIDNIVAQWESEFDTWLASVKSTLDEDVATALTAKVTALEDGTTPAGDASKLGGKDPSHYAKASDLKAEQIKGGYFPEVVRASPTGVANVGDSMLRNIYAGTSDMTAGTTALASGAIYVMYE